jgi:hypothetical protein
MHPARGGRQRRFPAGNRRAFSARLPQYARAMTTQAMGKLLDSYLNDLEGQPGFWRGVRNDVPVFVFSDDEHDRMRIMSPIGVVEQLEPDLLHVLLQANYDRALDARYAMRGNELWSVVVHPLATLATDDLPAMFDQVTTLVKNTGSTFASTELVFRSFPADQIVIETEDEDDDEEEGEEDGEANGEADGDEDEGEAGRR